MGGETYEELDVSGKKYLKNLHGLKRLRYIWDYYKIVPVLIAAAAFLVLTGFQMVKNARSNPYLEVVVLNARPDKIESLGNFGKTLSEKLDPDHEYDDIYFDGSINTEANDGEAVYREKLAVAVDQDVDLIVCGQEVLDEYRDEGIFADWKEVLGDDYAKYEAYMVDGFPDLSKSEKWNAAGAVSYSPAFLVMKENSKKTEQAEKLINYFFDT